MEAADRPFYEILQARLDELGENAFSLAAKSGIPYDKIRNVIRNDSRRADPKVETAREICAALGLDFYIGPRRETGPVENIAIDGANYAHIPLHDALLAAGSGYDNITAPVIDHVAFRRDWLERLGVTASGVRLAHVQGDSMQPTMWAGDLLMIDTTRTEPLVRRRDGADQRRSPIYALIDGGEARVKRIERPSVDQMLLISDNPDYMPELRQGSDIQAIKIIGKVVWWGHTAKE